MTKFTNNNLVFSLAFLATTTLLVFAPAADAGTINIQLSGLGVVYDGPNGTIHDSKSANGGNMNPADADMLATALFRLDSTVVDVRTMGDGGGDLYGDLLIDNVPGSIPLGTLTTVGGGGFGYGFDLFTTPGSIPMLSLDLDTVELFVDELSLFFTGVGIVKGEDLPAGLRYGVGREVAVSYTATLPSVNPMMETTMGFFANGTLNISGAAIPEPTSAALLLLAMAPLAAIVRRNRV